MGVLSNSTLRFVSLSLGTLVLLSAFQNCGGVSFSSSTDDSGLVGSQGATDLTDANAPIDPPVICDPLAPGNNVDPTFGLEGSLHYVDNRIPAANCADGKCTSRDYISQGTKVDAKLFLSRVFAPTRNFSEGFEVQGYGKLKDKNGVDLVEWFALDLKSNVVLSTVDEDGLYQFGTISDDGVTLTANNKDILVDEGEHSPRLACAQEAIALKKGDRLPIRLTYFQGPRTQIALILMWRKVDNIGLGDCGTSTGYITDATNLPSDLSSRGWKVLKPENFKLKEGYNLCSVK